MPEPLTGGQRRLLLALTTLVFAVELAVPVLWVTASHGVAIEAAVLGGLLFLGGAVALSTSVAQRRGVSFWTVFLLRDRGQSE